MRSVNVTLVAEAKPNTPLAGETINYNERFSWTWDQGRFGFGPHCNYLPHSSILNHNFVLKIYFSLYYLVLMCSMSILFYISSAGQLQRSFRQAQRRGLPIPILWVVDYFILDGENIRFGRFYRTAGWYCHILLWYVDNKK